MLGERTGGALLGLDSEITRQFSQLLGLVIHFRDLDAASLQEKMDGVTFIYLLITKCSAEV